MTQRCCYLLCHSPSLFFLSIACATIYQLPISLSLRLSGCLLPEQT
jgi:hypothetical protein